MKAEKISIENLGQEIVVYPRGNHKGKRVVFGSRLLRFGKKGNLIVLDEENKRRSIAPNTRIEIKKQNSWE